MIRKGSNNQIICFVIASILVILIAFHPMFLNGFMESYDGEYHLSRINSLYLALKAGIFPVKIHPAMANGYGYGSGFYYPNALYYFPALLMFTGLSLESVTKIFIFLLLFGAFGSTYYCTWCLSKNSYAAFLSAAMWTLGHSLLASNYYNLAPAITAAYVFLPMAIGGLVAYLMDDASPMIMIWGFIGLFYSHGITTLLGGCTCVLVALFLAGCILRCPEKLTGIFGGAVLTLISTAAYWLPMWQQFRALKVKAQAPWALESEHMPSIAQYFVGTFGPGWLLLFLSMTAMILGVRKWIRDGINIKAVVFFLCAIVLSIISYTTIFWKWLNHHDIHILQFPGRLYGPVTLCLCFFVALVYAELDSGHLKRGQHYKIICVCCIAISVNMSMILNERYKEHGLAALVKIENGTAQELGGGEEWLPIQTERTMLTVPDLAINQDGIKIKGNKSDDFVTFSFFADTSEEYYVVPFLYYRGYQAIIDTGETEYDISELLTQDADTGLLKVIIPNDIGGVQV